MQQNPYNNDYQEFTPPIQPTQAFNLYTPNLNIVKSYFRRKSVLVAAIVNTVICVLSVVTGFWSFVVYDKFFGAFVDKIKDYYEIDLGNISIYASPVGNFVSLFPSLIISCLVIFSFFSLYIKSKNPLPSSSPKVGIIIQFVLAIYNLVSICLVGFLFLIIAIFLPIAISNTVSDPDSNIAITAVFAILIFAFAITFAPALILAISKFNFFRSVKNTLVSNNLYSKGAKAFGVMNIIYAVFYGISILLTLLTILAASTASKNFLPNSEALSYLLVIMILSTIILVAEMASCIIIAKIALGYNKYINAIKNYSPTVFDNNNFENTGDNQFNSKICPQCHEKVWSDSQYCTHCGYRLR